MTRARDRWFHHGWPVAVPYVFAIMMFAIATMLMFFPGAIAPRVVAALPFIAIGVFALNRLGRLGAHFRAKHLVLVRTFSTKRISWERVKGFQLAPHGMGSLAGHVVLTDGTLVWIEGIGSWSRFTKQSPGAEAVIAEMNRLVGERRSARANT